MESCYSEASGTSVLALGHAAVLPDSADRPPFLVPVAADRGFGEFLAAAAAAAATVDVMWIAGDTALLPRVLHRFDNISPVWS